MAPFLSDNRRFGLYSHIKLTSNYKIIIQAILPAVNEKHTRMVSNIVLEPDFIQIYDVSGMNP
jgi:hypothetical protein